MIELFAVFAACRHVGRIIKRAGKAPGWWYVLTVLFWIGGELVGGIAGGLIFMWDDFATQVDPPLDPMVYVAALLGAIFGVVIVSSLAKRSARRTMIASPLPVPDA